MTDHRAGGTDGDGPSSTWHNLTPAYGCHFDYDVWNSAGLQCDPPWTAAEQF